MTDKPENYAAARNWLITLPVVLLLLTAILFGTSAYIHSQLLNLGAHIWPHYSYLRYDMAKPGCNPNANIGKEVKQAMAKKSNSSSSLFNSGPSNPQALRKSFSDQRQNCRQRIKLYHYNHKMTQSPWLRAYRTVELGMGEVNSVGQDSQAYVLVLLILICGIVAKAVDEHISLRMPTTRLDYRVSSFAQFAVNGILTIASFAWMLADRGYGGVSSPLLHYIWIAGFGILSLLSAYQFFNIPKDAKSGGSLQHALLTVPLYVYLGLAGFVYFFFFETYPAGMSIQLTKMVKFAELYTSVGLYVWVGMMIKHTRLAELIFDVARPWELGAEIITILVVLAAALPTAYTGASGIFVLAIGAVIYSELRIAGTRRQLAIAATAMSGSMGVVLAPCLMVVIIAALNKQVTTTELYGWGTKVFGLSALLFTTFVYATRETRPHIASPRKAISPMLRALVPLVPYVVLGAIVIVVYQRLIGQQFDEFSAPIILPLLMLVLLFYDRLRAKRKDRLEGALSPAAGAQPVQSEPSAGFWNAVRAATADTSVLIGALLLLMAMSVVFGGVVQRSGVMSYFPQHLGDPWLATAIFVVILVLIGMFMDPYGAIILVSATIAPVAYHNGINPVHFWMMVLVAFELGYLSPPVALNQLLTRQVVGEQEFYAAKEVGVEKASLWRRHEHVLLPIAIMGSSLLIVAFAPLVYGQLIQ